jgi:hypothetical protein
MHKPGFREQPRCNLRHLAPRHALPMKTFGTNHKTMENGYELAALR